MGAHEFEAVLARLYVDAPFRRRFLADPEEALAGLDLSETEKAGLAGIDRAGLVLAAGSYARKRADDSRPRHAGAPAPKPVEHGPARAARLGQRWADLAVRRLSAPILPGGARFARILSGILTRLRRR